MSIGIIVMLASLGVLAVLSVKVWFVVQWLKKAATEQNRGSD